MNTALAILNLSERPNNWLAPDEKFDAEKLTMTATSEVPRGKPAIERVGAVPSGIKNQFLILYVVGHGVQHGLVDGNGQILEEEKVAEEVKSRRNGHPTLVIWDVCFARSILHIGAVKAGKGSSSSARSPASAAARVAAKKTRNSWPANFIHVFSCRPFERTWHGAREPIPSRTLFSSVLCKAVAELEAQTQGQFGWKQLEMKLQHEFGAMQRPTIVPSQGPWKPSDFELAKWLGGASRLRGIVGKAGRASAGLDLR